MGLLPTVARAATTRTVCAVGCDFTTIAAAVTASAAGDTVTVGAGTYAENVTINKVITVRGAQAGVDARTRAVAVGLESTVTGGTGAAFTLTAPARVEGFRIAGTTDVGVEIAINAGGSRVADNIITDNKYGVEVLARGIDTIIERNRILDNDRLGGGVGIVTESAVGVAILDNRIEENDLYGIAVAGTVANGHDIALTGNEITGPRSALRLADASFVSVLDNSLEIRTEDGNQGSGDVVVVAGNVDDLLLQGNLITRAAGTLLGAGVITATGSSPNGQLEISGNRIVGHARGIRLPAGSIVPGSTLDAHRNQLVRNTVAAIVNDTTTPLDAQNNWFGCNAGPGGACNGATASPTLDIEPWIVVNFSVNPTPPLAGQTAAVTVSAQDNSDGHIVTGGDPVPDGMTLTFSTAVGSIAPMATTFLDGVRVATLTAPPAGGAGSISAVVDQQTLSQAVTILAPPPTNSAVPTISGTPETAVQLTCLPGAWTLNPSYVYAWLRNGTPVDAGATHTVLPADEGTQLSCRVTATPSGGGTTATATSASVSAVAAPTPGNTVLPVVSNDPSTGQAVSCSSGTWDRAINTYAYAWLRNGSVIGSQTGTSYTIQPVDEQTSLACRVTVTTAAGKSASATSAGVVAHAPVPPANSVLPTISVSGGGAHVGSPLSCLPGTWTLTPSFTYAWLRAGTPISGENATTYTIQQADVGAAIACRVTAAANTVTAQATSSSTVPTALPVPQNSVAPSISGTVMTGQLVTCNPGTWTLSPSFSYVWLRTGTAISGETASTHTIAQADEGAALQCRVATVATATMQSGAATSAPMVPYAVPAPVNSVAPAISGTLTTGSTLTCSSGSWSPMPNGYAYAWLRSGSVTSVTTQTYELFAIDELKSIACRVTATIPAGSSGAATSAAVVPTDVSRPENTALPTISGTTTTGFQLTCATGTWSIASTYTYAWLRSGATIAGAAVSTYTLDPADVGTSVTCRVTATANGRTAQATSAGVVPTALGGPTNSALPTISGAPTTGTQLSCSQGTWSDLPTYTYAWLRDGAPIGGATFASYTLIQADELTAIACRVTATVSGRPPSSATSVAVVARSPQAPVNSAVPSITGLPAITASTLTCDEGTWTLTPTYTYAWLRNGSPIAGATARMYQVVASDETTSVSCRVTGTANGRSVIATSSGVVPFAPAPPGNTVAPAISGSPVVTTTQLACSTGSWTLTPTFTFAWLRNGSPIGTQISSTYTLAPADEQTSITCRVTATVSGPAGAQTATATSSAVVPQAPSGPTNSVPPSISGTAASGSRLTCAPGTWSMSPTFTYQWQRDGLSIGGATNSEYDVQGADEVHSITCRVTATSGVQSAVATSAAVVPSPPGTPVNSALPTISGAATTGEVLTCSAGTWTLSPSYAYAWLRAGGVVSTGFTRTVVTPDEGTSLTCRVTATAGGQSASATSVGVVPAPPVAPVNTGAPSISGTALVGSTLACSTGAWTLAPTFQIQWLRNNGAIGGAVDPTYTLVGADALTSLTCRVTATLGTRHVDAFSSPVVPQQPTAPINSALPSISGTPMTGETLTCPPGTWSLAPAFTYAWLRGAAPISGATLATYTLTFADEGTSLTCRVTATANSQSASAVSVGVVPFAAQPPVNTVVPGVSGAPVVGTQLTCTPGAWTLTPTYTYAWTRNGVAIAGATATTYTLTQADAYTLVSCAVTATAGPGQRTVSSAGVVPMPLPAPAATTLPTIAGIAMFNETLVCTTGAWTRTPTFSFQWLRNGAPIAGATAATYGVTRADELTALACIVIAHAGADTGTAMSAPVVALPVPPPVNTTLPTVSGVAEIGQTLTCVPGAWTRSPAFTFQWLRNGGVIAGSTNQTYVIQGGDANDNIACRVTGTISGSSADATSSAVTPELITPKASLALVGANGASRGCGASLARPCADRRSGTLRVGGTVLPARIDTPVVVVYERRRGSAWVLSMSRTVKTSARGAYVVAIPGRLITSATWRVRARVAASPANAAANSAYQYFTIKN